MNILFEEKQTVNCIMLEGKISNAQQIILFTIKIISRPDAYISRCKCKDRSRTDCKSSVKNL